MAPLHKHKNNVMSNEQNDKQSAENGGVIGKPAVMGRPSYSRDADFRECERVFTESEVRAMLIGIRNDYILDNDKEWLTEYAAKHGIVLDPA